MDGRPPAVLARVRLRPLQDPERSVISGPLANRLLQARDRLDVVVEDVGPGGHDHTQGRFLAVEVGDQDLHAHAGAGVAQPADRLGEDAGTAVVEVVAGDARDDDVLEPKSSNRLGHAPGLVQVVDRRLAGLDGTEPAGPGADISQDHDRGRALVPALPDVRAVRLLADGVER